MVICFGLVARSEFRLSPTNLPNSIRIKRRFSLSLFCFKTISSFNVLLWCITLKAFLGYQQLLHFAIEVANFSNENYRCFHARGILHHFENCHPSASSTGVQTLVCSQYCGWMPEVFVFYYFRLYRIACCTYFGLYCYIIQVLQLILHNFLTQNSFSKRTIRIALLPIYCTCTFLRISDG